MDYALLAYRSGRHLPLGPAALVLDQLWGPGLELLIVVVLLFPDGRLSSRFWRWALRAFWVVYTGQLVALAVATAGALAGRPVHVDATGGLSAVDNPVGGPRRPGLQAPWCSSCSRSALSAARC